MTAFIGSAPWWFLLVASAFTASFLLAAVPNAAAPYRTRFLIVGSLSAIVFMAMACAAFLSFL